ncbi:MAG TPA: hypothetical protein VFN56_02280 [Candidatus Saccharimonadales bacterium]|nr:hypothetical protein [Candidatus Saccharimonadales bacterium]
MSEQSSNHEQLVSPQQAEQVFKEIGELTTLQGTNYGDRNTYGEVTIVVPDSVAEHLPPTETDSQSVGRTIYVTQIFDRETGQPKQEGVVGMVTFTQKEKRDADLGYWTNVNYHVVTADGQTHQLERHVTSGEYGKAYAARQAGRMAFTREAMEQQLAELMDLQRRDTEARKVEAELGLSTVTSREAEQIAEVLASLNNNR